jgi:hypothetical protein
MSSSPVVRRRRGARSLRMAFETDAGNYSLVLLRVYENRGSKGGQTYRFPHILQVSGEPSCQGV